jgi:homoserine kinase
MLGAALAQGSAQLFAEAIQDRLHEPYRAKNAPLLERVRGDLPDGALGATLSGSGPSVIVWVRPDAADSCEEGLARRFADASVLRFTVSAEGAGRT